MISIRATIGKPCPRRSQQDKIGHQEQRPADASSVIVTINTIGGSIITNNSQEPATGGGGSDDDDDDNSDEHQLEETGSDLDSQSV
jgi:hypothetical protein